MDLNCGILYNACLNDTEENIINIIENNKSESQILNFRCKCKQSLIICIDKNYFNAINILIDIEIVNINGTFSDPNHTIIKFINSVKNIIISDHKGSNFCAKISDIIKEIFDKLLSKINYIQKNKYWNYDLYCATVKHITPYYTQKLIDNNISFDGNINYKNKYFSNKKSLLSIAILHNSLENIKILLETFHDIDMNTIINQTSLFPDIKEYPKIHIEENTSHLEFISILFNYYKTHDLVERKKEIIDIMDYFNVPYEINNFDCPVCLKQHISNIYKLKCNHEICYNCSNSMVNKDLTIQCPMCRAANDISENPPMITIELSNMINDRNKIFKATEITCVKNITTTYDLYNGFMDVEDFDKYYLVSDRRFKCSKKIFLNQLNFCSDKCIFDVIIIEKSFYNKL